MKNCLFFTLLWFGSLSAAAGTLTNAPALRTNVLSIYLVAGNVPRASMTDGTASPAGVKLMPEPILSDADFVAWNVTNHTLVITPTAAKRIGGKCSFLEVPFVLMANGEPIYLGLFGTSTSSSSAAVPVILTDHIVMDCFLGLTNVPPEVWPMIGRGDPHATERLVALTNATTNVTLRIDAGYPPPNGFGLGADRRADKRITAAVEKLFRKSNNP